MNEGFSSCGAKVSIRQISILTGIDRDTVTRRLHGLPSESGAKNSRIYLAPAALRAVLAPALAPEGELEKLKARTEHLNAELKQLELAKRSREYLPKGFVLELISSFILHVRERTFKLRQKKLPVTKAWEEENGDAWESIAREVGRRWQVTLPWDLPEQDA
jgi:hypothetical protein